MDVAQRRSSAQFLIAQGLSKAKSCIVVGLSRKSLTARPAVDNSQELKAKLQEVWRPNMGYRMAHALVKESFAPLNVKRVHRLWKDLAFSCQKRYRKKRTGSPVPLSASQPNQVWCLDFCHDACQNGTKLKILGILDEFTKECLALEVSTSFKSLKVQAVLQRLFNTRGAPAYLRSDNGSEFISRSLAVFLSQQGTKSQFIKPGSPWQNGYMESFNSRLRAECLDAQIFFNLADAQMKLRVHQRYYNEVRPHSSTGYEPPTRAAAQWKKDSGYALPLLPLHVIT